MGNLLKSPSGNNVVVNDDGNVCTILHVKSGLYFYVSSIDTDYVLQHGWTVYSIRNKKFGYTTRNDHGHTEFLHRYIMKQYMDLSNPELEIDHIDRNPANNTRENLRLVSRRMNNLNKRRTDNSKTQLHGVSTYLLYPGIYYARIRANKHKQYLGRYDDKYNAGLVYDSYIYHNRPESEWGATNLYNGKIPQEVLDKYNIDPNDLSTIPFIPSCKHGNIQYNGVYFDNTDHCWKAYIRNISGKQQSIKQAKRMSELEIVAYREQYLLDHPELDQTNPCNYSNIIWHDEESDGLINVIGIILTRDEMEEKTRGY